MPTPTEAFCCWVGVIHSVNIYHTFTENLLALGIQSRLIRCFTLRFADALTVSVNVYSFFLELFFRAEGSVLGYSCWFFVLWDFVFVSFVFLPLEVFS